MPIWFKCTVGWSVIVLAVLAFFAVIHLYSTGRLGAVDQCEEDCTKWESQTEASCSPRFADDDCWCLCEIKGDGTRDMYSVQVW